MCIRQIKSDCIRQIKSDWGLTLFKQEERLLLFMRGVGVLFVFISGNYSLLVVILKLPSYQVVKREYRGSLLLYIFPSKEVLNSHNCG